MEYGCVSGMIGGLIYYHDTIKFFEKFKVVIKPQYVDVIPKIIKTHKTVLELLTMKNERGELYNIIKPHIDTNFKFLARSSSISLISY